MANKEVETKTEAYLKAEVARKKGGSLPSKQHSHPLVVFDNGGNHHYTREE